MQTNFDEIPGFSKKFRLKRTIKKLQITGFVANLLRSGRPAKLSVDAKSIYRSTDAKT